MSANYDNWERLVAAVLKKQQLWQLFHDHSRSPSILSEASDLSSSFNSRPPLDDLAVDFARLGSLSTHNRRTPKLVFVSDFCPAIDFKDVHLASSEFLGMGTLGSSYAAAMDNGVRIVVKRIKSVNMPETEFNHQMAIVGNIRHDNVVSLRAYYSSKDERLMLYDHYSRGSVYALLHDGRNGEPRAYLDRKTRIRIAIGAARGIAEIHKHNGGKLVHGNIKTPNVFYKADEYGCVSDLGQANLIETKFAKTTYCHAPEVKNTRNMSQASDVYSFGVLILELLTGRPAVHVPGGPQAVDLVKLFTSMSSIRNRMMAGKVFDANLLKSYIINEKMVEMFQIGMKCVEKSTKKRPKMSEVVKLLEEIDLFTPIRPIPITHVEKKLVFIDDSYHTKFDFEDLLRASAEVLGKGYFGTSYKAKVVNGSTIVVKRLRDVTVTSEYFHLHTKTIGSTVHRNIVGLRAFFYSKDEKLLVYDYCDRGSVSDLLHGKTDTVRAPLDWETRLKIAVGAARGLAHIHAQHGQEIVHGNIKSSNIFLNGQHYGTVSEAGLAKVVSSVRKSPPGYFAPEVSDSRCVSQASDVFGFGVVLLELLSGKPSQFTADDGEVVSLVDWIHSVVREEEYWTAQVFDPELPRYGNMEETMVRLVQIAMDCVNTYFDRRPMMSQVMTMLEDISGVEPLSESRLEDTTLEQPPLPIELRLKDLLEDMLPTMSY